MFTVVTSCNRRLLETHDSPGGVLSEFLGLFCLFAGFLFFDVFFFFLAHFASCPMLHLIPPVNKGGWILKINPSHRSGAK